MFDTLIRNMHDKINKGETMDNEKNEDTKSIEFETSGISTVVYMAGNRIDPVSKENTEHILKQIKECDDNNKFQSYCSKQAENENPSGSSVTVYEAGKLAENKGVAEVDTTNEKYLETEHNAEIVVDDIQEYKETPSQEVEYQVTSKYEDIQIPSNGVHLKEVSEILKDSEFADNDRLNEEGKCEAGEENGNTSHTTENIPDIAETSNNKPEITVNYDKGVKETQIESYSIGTETDTKTTEEKGTETKPTDLIESRSEVDINKQKDLQTLARPEIVKHEFVLSEEDRPDSDRNSEKSVSTVSANISFSHTNENETMIDEDVLREIQKEHRRSELRETTEKGFSSLQQERTDTTIELGHLNHNPPIIEKNENHSATKNEMLKSFRGETEPFHKPTKENQENSCGRVCCLIFILTILAGGITIGVLIGTGVINLEPIKQVKESRKLGNDATSEKVGKLYKVKEPGAPNILTNDPDFFSTKKNLFQETSKNDEMFEMDKILSHQIKTHGDTKIVESTSLKSNEEEITYFESADKVTKVDIVNTKRGYHFENATPDIEDSELATTVQPSNQKKTPSEEAYELLLTEEKSIMESEYDENELILTTLPNLPMIITGKLTPSSQILENVTVQSTQEINPETETMKPVSEKSK